MVLTCHNQHATDARGEVQIGGVIYAEAADKAARFVMDCNQMGIPIVFIQDVVGFMVGKDAEHSGIIRSGAKLVNALSNAVVPKITIIVGGSFGAGNYAMCGKAYDPRFIFGWPIWSKTGLPCLSVSGNGWLSKTYFGAFTSSVTRIYFGAVQNCLMHAHIAR